MRVLVVTNFYPPHHYGGYELSCRDVVDAWRERGHDVVVLCSDLQLPGRENSPAESRDLVRRDLKAFVRDSQFQRVALPSRPALERTNTTALQDALVDLEPDVVSVWHMLGLSAGLLTTLARSGIPCVCVVCDEWPGYILRTDPWMKIWTRVPRLAKFGERLFGAPTSMADLDAAASWCFTSHKTRDRCLKASPWLFPRSTVAYLGVNLDEFPIDRRVHTDDWQWRLVTAGRLDPRKGFSTAIRALSLLPAEAELDICSAADGSHRQNLERVAYEAGVAGRVRFSLQDRSGLREQYSGADAVLFPSEWEEPFGLVPLEAMACGTPVVATGTGGSGEFLANGRNCLLFAPGDPASLAGALRRLAGSLTLRAQLVEAGWELVDELSLDRLVDFLEVWHRAAVGGFAAGQPAPRDIRHYAEQQEYRAH